MTTNNHCTEKQPSQCKRFKCIITSITLAALILSSAYLFYQQQKLEAANSAAFPTNTKHQHEQ